MHRMPPKDGAEADKLKQLTECCEVLLTSLSADVQTKWHRLLIDKLTDMKNNTRGFDVSKDDFESMLEWALKNNDESVLSELLKKVFSEQFEAAIKMRFVIALRGNQNQVAALLLKYSGYLRVNIPTFKGTQSTEKHGTIGSTVLQYSAMEGNTELCKLLVNTISGLEQIDDFYGNTCLHYAATSGNPECYDYFLSLHPEWVAHTNIFGHIPDDYLAENIGTFPRHEQGFLIDKFTKYLEHEASEMTAEEVNGLCFGIAPVHALFILRGEQDNKDYGNMVDIISKWDGSRDSLANIITDPHLNILGLTTTKHVFLYLFSQYFYMFNMQFHDKTVTKFSRADISSQFAFVNKNRDKVTSIFDHGEGNLTKEECLEILKRNIMPNVMIAITVGPEVVPLFNDEPGHQLCIAVDSGANIYLCDPNSPYKAIPIEYKYLNKIADIAFRYNNNIKGIEVYKYTPSFENKSDLSSIISSNQSFFSSLLSSRGGSEINMLTQACMADAPITVRNLLDALEQRFGSPPLEEKKYKDLISLSLKFSSYRCVETLLNDYCSRNQLSIDHALNTMGISADDMNRFNEYLQNKTIFNPTIK